MRPQRIAHYEVVGKIGEGGMGEVYRATDSKLNREVALKFLPDSLAQDADYLARFSREAELLASLNHPNIATIHGIEVQDGVRALVMELVPGDTLQDRMRRSAPDLQEILHIAHQIASALEEAHEHGVVHRDLKPANVKITPDGRVKVLDFGLAKATERAASTDSDIGDSPTLSLAATQAGVVLGTAAYMSPEQASGLGVDRRADIWSFGVVLFEMVARKALFQGETAAHIMAGVLRADIDWEALPEDLPRPLLRLLRRCLERDAKNRLRDIGEARIALQKMIAGDLEEEEAPVAVAAPSRLRVLPWVVAAVAVAVATFMLVTDAENEVERPPSMRLKVEVGGDPLWEGLGSSVVLSPDGRQVAVVLGGGGDSDLYVRPIDQLEGTRLAGGEVGVLGAYNPFFSPDSQWIGFVTSSELKRIPISGGTPQTVTSVTRSRGATWLDDDTIVFAMSPTSPLYRISANGGEPEAITQFDSTAGEVSHRWPYALPGGHAVLFTSHSSGSGFDNAAIEVLDLDNNERKIIHRGGTYPQYLPSGYLTFVNRGTLFAVRFDARKLETNGTAMPVLQEVASNTSEGGAQMGFSQLGTLAYASGSTDVEQYPVVWVDANGQVSPLWDQPGGYGNPRLSPDGKRLSLTVLRDDNWDVWVYDLERAVSTRLTFDEGIDSEQIWSPDGEYLYFSSDRNGADDIYRKRADGSGDIERLTEATDVQHWTSSISRDGRYLAFSQPTTQYDIGILDLEQGGKPEIFFSTPFSEAFPDFSPDGQWLAYASNESGQWEVYVRPFPAAQGKWQVSDGGGAYPQWSGDGKRLFWRVNDGVMVADVETAGSSFRAGRARLQFTGGFRGGQLGVGIGGFQFRDFDITRDGERFVMFPDPERTIGFSRAQVTIVTDWFDEVERLTAGRGD